MKKIHDIGPAKNSFGKSIAKLAYHVTALQQYIDSQVGTKIDIHYEESKEYLGTTDGDVYTIKPVI